MPSIDLQSSDGENFEEEGEYVEEDALSIKEEKPDRDDHREDEYGEKDVKDKVGIKKNQYALSYEEDLARPWSSPCTCTCRDYMLHFLIPWAALRRRSQTVKTNTERKILKTKQVSWTTANRRGRRRRRGQKGAVKRPPPPTKEQLDKEIDSYMADTRSAIKRPPPLTKEQLDSLWMARWQAGNNLATGLAWLGLAGNNLATGLNQQLEDYRQQAKGQLRQNNL